MLFHSLQFIFFLALVLTVWRILPGQRGRQAWLLAASYVFYGAWDPRFLLLIWLSTFIDFRVAVLLDRTDAPRARKRLLLLSLASNLGMLGFFKYADFGLDNLRVLLEALGVQVSVPTLRIILPVGISFYTFQTISYTVDVYRRRREAVRDPLLFSLYVAFFPQLVAGPIEQSTTLLPQLEQPRDPTREDIRIGAHWILLGYFKKLVLADSLAPLVQSVFDDPSAASWAARYAALVAFALQIYGDFCGYTLIARGVARWFGIDLLRNFHHPYLATSPREFWHRWHISLSIWLRDYLYIPLGGSRGGKARTCRNLLLTMVLGGLWHGAAWNFVAWGAFHGLLLVACFLWLPKTFEAGLAGARRWTAILLTGQLTLLGWWFFRVKHLSEARAWLDARAGLWQAGDARWVLPPLALGLLLLAYHAWLEDGEDELRLYHATAWRRPAYLFLAACTLAAQVTAVPFIYFQF